MAQAIIQRRARPECSPEIQAVLRLIAVFTNKDLDLADAVVDSRWNLGKAADLLGISNDALRQRLSTFVRRIQTAIPAYDFRHGPKGHEVSYHQFNMAGLLGVEDSREEA